MCLYYTLYAEKKKGQKVQNNVGYFDCKCKIDDLYARKEKPLAKRVIQWRLLPVSRKETKGQRIMFCVKGSLRRSRVRENAKTLTSSLMRVEIITHAPSASQARHLPPGGRLMLESVYTVASNNSVAENAFVRCRYMPTKNHPSNEWFVEGYYR